MTGITTRSDMMKPRAASNTSFRSGRKTPVEAQPLVFDDAENLFNSAYHHGKRDLPTEQNCSCVGLSESDRKPRHTHIPLPQSWTFIRRSHHIVAQPAYNGQPEGLAAYLSMFGVGLNEVQAVNLFLRTQQRFTEYRRFWSTLGLQEHGTVDLGLLANDSRDLESDISELSGDEILRSR